MVVIINRTMNTTNIEKHTVQNEQVELYLLLIVIKLTIFFSIKVLKSCAEIYRAHNKKVINKHNKTTIAKLAKKIEKPTETKIQMHPE